MNINLFGSSNDIIRDVSPKKVSVEKLTSKGVSRLVCFGTEEELEMMKQANPQLDISNQGETSNGSKFMSMSVSLGGDKVDIWSE